MPSAPESGWAGLSHTAATATPDLALAAVFREAGVLRAEDLTEMFDLLGVLETVPLPAGSRVVALGNSGCPGVLAADACEAALRSMWRCGGPAPVTA
ncbi:MAG: hypothetical protein LH469_06395 [Frankiaceae bacterium]|nr:hypothetical protein [Frankiaceae bacterium]